MAGSGGRREDERVVPVYALTGGRTRSNGRDLSLESMVAVTEHGRRHEPSLQLELHAIVAMLDRAKSLAEIGAALKIPIGVVRVLVSDLADAGYVTISLPVTVDPNGRPNRQILEKLLDGLRSR